MAQFLADRTLFQLIAGHGPAQHFCQGYRLLQVGVRQNDREFFATKARDKALPFDLPAQCVGDKLQHLVAGQMSIQIVESLEVVHVDKQEGQGPPACIRSLKGVPKVSVQMSSVADTRERVGEGLCAYGREIDLEPDISSCDCFNEDPR